MLKLARLFLFLTICSIPITLFAVPAITSLNPNFGEAEAVNLIEINGAGFTGATQVNFGSKMTVFVVTNDQLIVALAPPGVPGTTVHVTVTTAAGTSPTTNADRFTYLEEERPLPPSHFTAKIIKKKCGGENSNCGVQLKWRPSLDPTVVGYRLYRNGTVIDETSACGPFCFHDCEVRCDHCITYRLVSFNAQNIESTSLEITLSKQKNRHKCKERRSACCYSHSSHD